MAEQDHWVYKMITSSWCLLYDVSLPPGVHKPLGLQDAHLLVLEARLGGGRSRLIVYNLDTQTSKKLDIFAYKTRLLGIPYFESVEKRRRKGMVIRIPEYVVGESS